MAKIFLVTVVVVHPLCVKDIVESDHILGLVHGSTPDTTKLLHVSAYTEQQTEVHAKRTDVGSCLTANPKYTKLPFIVKLAQLALVDGSDTELALDGRNEGRTLEESSRESLEGASKLGLAAWQFVMEANDTHVFFSSTLLGLDQTSGAINANNKASCDLGVESSAVSSLFNPIHILENPWGLGVRLVVPQDPLDPSYDFVTGRVGWLIKVDNARADVLLQVASKRCATCRNRGVMRSSDENC